MKNEKGKMKKKKEESLGAMSLVLANNLELSRSHVPQIKLHATIVPHKKRKLSVNNNIYTSLL